MLVEALVAVPLRSRVSEGPGSPWLDALADFLLEGSLRPPVTESLVSSGAVLARLHRTVKSLDPAARVTAGEGGADVFETLAEAPPGEELHAVPPPWADGLLGGTAHVSLQTPGLAASVSARFALRSRGRVPPLRLVVRGVRAELLPSGADDPTYAADLGVALRRKGAFADLRDLLVHDGATLANAVADGFADLVEGRTEVKTRVRLFERPEGLEDVVRGLPDGTARHLEVTGDWFRALRPGVEVLRHRWDGGVELWRGEVALG
jgi:hypothetical protein